MQDELGLWLRSWRERVSPPEVKLQAGIMRRVPGLRREEVAQLAGVSLDYLARLEQGRATNPSGSVLASLARALRLADDERAHLFRVAGHAEPTSRTINRHIAPRVQRLLDRLADVPVMVLDASWQVLATNRLASALIGDVSVRLVAVAGRPRHGRRCRLSIARCWARSCSSRWRPPARAPVCAGSCRSRPTC